MASRPIIAWTVVLILASLHLKNFAVFAQDCYYPNGSLSTGSSREAPCSADGGICCPLNWECMSDGLCFYEPDNYYGRYSCTDPTWKACPNICTYDYTAWGGEAILQCSNGKWCCDGNRVSGNCCNEADTKFFELDKPKSVTSITALAAVTTLVDTIRAGTSTTSSSEPPPATTHTITHVTGPTSTTPTPAAATVTHESTTTGKDGSKVTITEVTTYYPSGTGMAAMPGHSTGHSGTNIGMIVGLALGIPLVLILAGVLVFMLCRRRRKNKDYTNIHTRPSTPPEMANYNPIPPGTHALEAGGFPVADTRDKDNRTSELYGNDTYIHSPAVSGRTSESSPPSYSPNGRSPTTQAKSPAMAQIQEEPSELWGGHVYAPYRLPNAQLAPERKVEGVVESPVSPLEQS